MHLTVVLNLSSSIISWWLIKGEIVSTIVVVNCKGQNAPDIRVINLASNGFEKD